MISRLLEQHANLTRQRILLHKYIREGLNVKGHRFMITLTRLKLLSVEDMADKVHHRMNEYLSKLNDFNG